MEPEEVVRRMDIIASNNELFDILEECDSQVCLYTWEALIAGSCEYYLEADNGKKTSSDI